MAINPIIHNEGGVNRFLDYLSTVPEFMKVEDDVVSMLQLFSDYINNAYRNTTIVDKFRFRLVATDNNVVSIKKSLEHLENLFRETESRGLKMLYISKPQGNPRAGSQSADSLPEDWPIFREYIKYSGTIDNLGPNIITIPNPENGDKFFIEFTRDTEIENTGVYIFNKSRNILQLDPNGSSQDPFNSTVNTPFFTDVGLSPRILEFNVTDIGNVITRRVTREGILTYYDVFLDATIYNIEDITGTVTKTINNNSTGNQDFNYIVDYYDILNNIPSTYTFKYEIDFSEDCRNIDWKYSENTQTNSIAGLSLFYARDLTNIDSSTSLVNREGRNIYNDPIFDLNTSANDIITISGNGTDVTVKTSFRHSLSENENITIFGTDNFDGNYVVSKILDFNVFRFIDTTVATEDNTGRVITRNLFYSKTVDNPSEFSLIVPYKSLDGDREFKENDFIVRLENEVDSLFTTFSASQVDIINNTITVNSLEGFPNVPLSESLTVTIRGTGSGTLPVGLSEGVIYEMFINDKDRRIVSFSGIDITALGTGEFYLYYEGNGRRYFDAAVDVDVSENTIKLNNIDKLKVGDNVYFRNISPNILLPAPLESNKPYQISEINNDTIKLEGVDLVLAGVGVCDITVVIPTDNNIGRVDEIIIENPITSIFDGSGRIVLKSFSGDMITKGIFGRYESTTLKAFAEFDTTAIQWSGNLMSDNTVIGGTPPRFPIYYKNDLVVFEGIQYRVIPSSLQIDNSSRTPIEDPQNYERFMDSIISRPSVFVFNPYMYGLHRTSSLGFGEDIDYTRSYSELSSEMYIQQVEDLSLRYGFDQREWLFNPRFAPQSNVVRNGYLDIVTNESEVYNPVDNTLVVLSISKANTVDNNPLFGVNTPIIRTINSLVTASGIATVQTVGSHGYKTGSVITVQGSSIAETNGSFVINVVSIDTFTYEITNMSALIATGTIESIYQPNTGDFINVLAQNNPNENGLYIVKVAAWSKYDASKLSQPSIIFTKQNLFTTGILNPDVAKGDEITVRSVILVGSGVVQVNTIEPHGYVIGTTVEIRDAVEGDYNGRFEVELIVDDFTFQYNIGNLLIPSSPASGNIKCQSDAWYQYKINNIEWQKVSKFNDTDFVNQDGTLPVDIPFDDGNNNVDLLFGVYNFTLSDGSEVNFTNNLIVNINDQLISSENGVYRVNENALWTRLDTKLSMKVRNIQVNSYDNPNYIGLELDEEEVIYRTFSDIEVNEYINNNISSSELVYKVTYPFISEFKFDVEAVDNIDTAGSIDKQYNAKFDYNSVVNKSDMSPEFEGIPDMDYPLVEKIERIAYNKDSRAIDINLIGYLARYMGYDITDWVESILSSKNPDDVDMAVRRAVEQLPQYYTLKSTESGLELLLLIFGIVGELVTQWTPQDDPYSEFIPDYQLRGREYADMLDGIRRSYVPTPHFSINVNIAGNYENQILQGDHERLLSAINRFKPINTVFDGIMQYIKAKLKATVSISRMNAKGKQKCSVGFDNLDWSNDLIDNDCL